MLYCTHVTYTTEKGSIVYYSYNVKGVIFYVYNKLFCIDDHEQKEPVEVDIQPSQLHYAILWPFSELSSCSCERSASILQTTGLQSEDLALIGS